MNHETHKKHERRAKAFLGFNFSVFRVFRG